MKIITVNGISGSGKTTSTSILGEMLGVTPIHVLDPYYTLAARVIGVSLNQIKRNKRDLVFPGTTTTVQQWAVALWKMHTGLNFNWGSLSIPYLLDCSRLQGDSIALLESVRSPQEANTLIEWADVRKCSLISLTVEGRGEAIESDSHVYQIQDLLGRSATYSEIILNVGDMEFLKSKLKACMIRAAVL